MWSILLIALASLAAAELWPEESFDFTEESMTIFKTEPDFKPVHLKVLNQSEDSSKLQPGYLFVSPHIFHIGFGPHLFTQDGELIWYGQDVVGRFGGHIAQAMDFGPCDYLGQTGTHLCFSEGRPGIEDLDPARRTGGVNRIFDNSYAQVGQDILRVAGYDSPNPHEFTMTVGAKSFLQSIFHKKRMDLREYEGRKKGYVYEPCFQEADIQTKRQIFRWCYLKHHPVWHTDLFLRVSGNTGNRSTKVGGKGTTKDPWDFAHLNALDKNLEGDYLVSLRHLDQVLKIAGPDNVHGVQAGTTLWRLGGRGSDIKALNDTLKFSRQHHTRFIRTTANETIISLFDNSYDGVWSSSEYSSAKIISINNITKTAKLIHEYPHPYRRLAASQGSVQTFPNGNVFVGWGARPQVTEFSSGGDLLYHAQILPDPGNLTNYRSFKGTWTGKPREDSLKLVPYCKSCIPNFKDPTGDPFYVYVSWNGATAVASYKFFLSSTSAFGPWFRAGHVPKRGFETQAKLESTTFAKVASFPPWVRVDALDVEGRVLGRKVARTFVPGAHLDNKCDASSCFDPKRFVYDEFQSSSLGCRISLAPMTIVLVILCAAMELGVFLCNRMIQRASSPAWNAGVLDGWQFNMIESLTRSRSNSMRFPEPLKRP